MNRRLKKRAEFVAVSKNKRSVSMPHFILQYRPKPEQHAPCFGFTVSKKVGNAVVRNRVKRRLREVVRLFEKEQLENNQEKFSLLSFDFVLIGRTSAASALFTDLIDHFQTALQRVVADVHPRTP